MLGDIGDYLKATFGEIGHHPLQAAGAALGVPGYDPLIGGTFNNHKGGALLSPTGNFTSSAWNEMYQNNPNSTSGLNLFHGINSAADVIAPMIAGGYASGALGGAGGSSGSFGGLGSGTSSLPDIQGSGSLFGTSAGLDSSMPASATSGMSGWSPYSSAFGGQQYPFSMSSGSSFNTKPLQQWLQNQSQQKQQQAAQPAFTPQMQQQRTMEPYSLTPFSPIATYPADPEAAAQRQAMMMRALSNYGG